jgi:hypothetical protein
MEAGMSNGKHCDGKMGFGGQVRCFRHAATRMTVSIGVAVAVVMAAVPLSRPSTVPPAVQLSASTALILGGTGLPTPPQSYVDAVHNLYLAPYGYGAYAPQAFTTPEQAYPLTWPNSLSADDSVAQGVSILDSAIKEQLAAGTDPTDNHVVVFGYSQGAAVVSQEEAQLEASSSPPDPKQLSFVMVGNPSNPNGGINQRFTVPGAPLSLSSLGQTFNYSPAVSNTYPTASYTQEYDGFADFPQYPLNLLSVLNAYIGVFTQHFSYLNLTPEQLNSAVELTTVGDTTTKYYMIPTAKLPLLVPVRLIPLVGNPLADLLEPDMRVLVNLGYGSIDNGWSPDPANVPTPFGLFPTDINPADVLTALAKGIPQGITNALNDFKTPTLFDTSSLSGFLAGFHTVGFTPSDTPSLLQLLAGFTAFGNGGVPVSSNDGFVKTLTNLVAQDISVARPLADTALALGVGLPQYDAELFTSQLAAGNLLNAVGMPLAADIGLAPFALLSGAFPVIGAVATTVTQLAEITGVEPNASAAATASKNALAIAPKVIPDTPKVSADTREVKPLTAKINSVTAKFGDVTAKIRTATTKISPATPKVTASTSPSQPRTHDRPLAHAVANAINTVRKAVKASAVGSRHPAGSDAASGQ